MAGGINKLNYEIMHTYRRSKTKYSDFNISKYNYMDLTPIM